MGNITIRELHSDSNRRLWDAGEGPVAGLGGLEPEMHRRGWIGR